MRYKSLSSAFHPKARSAPDVARISKMKMSMLLMTMVLLVGAASATHDVNLKAIFKEISNLNQTSTLVRDTHPPAVDAGSR